MNFIKWCLIHDPLFLSTFREIYDFFPDPLRPHIFQKAVYLLLNTSLRDICPVCGKFVTKKYAWWNKNPKYADARKVHESCHFKEEEILCY